MKWILTTLTVIAVAVAAAVGSTGSALSAGSAKKIVPIVMRDPGCHWFSAGGKYTKKLVVRGATTFLNLDEAALVFKGNGATRHVAVGKSLTVGKRGHYTITMVKQAPDDNHLKLVVK
jgi:hypothetical protein